MSNQCRIDVESMPNRPLKRGGRGGFEAEVRGSVPNKPLTRLAGDVSLCGKGSLTWALPQHLPQ